MSFTRTRGSAGQDILQTAPLTVALIVANVLVYIAQQGSSSIFLLNSGTTGGQLQVQGSVDAHFGLWGPMVASGEWYRLVTSAFLHASPLHIGSNMLALWFIGRSLEPALGTLRTACVYFVSLAAGSLGVMVLEPGSYAIGASGAIFGLMGALAVIARARGISIWQSGIGTVILLNLAITFTIPGIAKGAHVGGLIAGGALGWLMLELPKRRGLAGRNPGPIVAISVAAFVVLLIVAVALAQSKYPSTG